MEHITVYREPGRYAGWPANYGMWNWGKEIVLGFTVGYHKTDGQFHARDTAQPFTNVQARSLDGGRSWHIEDFPGETPGSRGLSADEHMDASLGIGEMIVADDVLQNPPGNINFTHPDFALMCARTGLKQGVQSFFYVSYDRCKHWEGPYRLPMFGQTGIAARSDYLVDSPDTCYLFLTANKTNGQEGKVICVRTTDQGKSFAFVSDVSGEPEGDSDFAIMPASLRLASGRILSAIRCRQGEHAARTDSAWIDVFYSDDNAHSWEQLARPVMFDETGHSGNPATLHQLSDGRLVLIYGNRDKPYTIAARLSEDNGNTWGDEIAVRRHGGNHDIGYPRTVLLDDDTVVTAYYFNENADQERFIEATIWRP